ncbi:hypothetical protein FLONG3_2293 [Fusarium longipes]|uniref:Uncharacterized protein n=1 Tax=Fusarium longipes TaxID=694270 RepID=A0A395T5Q1_9HYPO|nr:hypothetical protein FLONG3_2293 [Fusarium longipes]
MATQYQPLDLEKSSGLTRHLPTLSPHSYSLLRLAKDVVLLSLAVPGLISLLCPALVCEGVSSSVSTLKSSVDPTICNCGSSVAEALSLGCKYDSLAAAWLPEPCRDDALTAEFERSGDAPNGQWSYWADLNHTQELSLEELGKKGDDPSFRFYTTAEWHRVHCAFFWRKMFRSHISGVIIEPRFDNEEHVIHCGSVLLHTAVDDKGARAGVSFRSD